MSKLEKLFEIEGYDALDELLDAAFSDSVSPPICTNDECGDAVKVEPDQVRDDARALATTQ